MLIVLFRPGMLRVVLPTRTPSAVIARMTGHLNAWARRMSQRVTVSDVEIDARRGRSARRGILPFLVDGSEVAPELTEKYRGPAQARYLPDPGEE